jgi:hypothetical protein
MLLRAAGLIGLLFGQQAPFRARTDLVIVPFQATRGSRSVSDLKPSDIALLEDGVPRSFTVFESPPDHPSLELVVMFDVTNIGGDFWDPKNLSEFTSRWNEAMTQAILDAQGAAIRISIYRFDQRQPQRLCRSAGDPKEILYALRRLQNPAPGDTLVGLAVPREAGVPVPDGGPAKPWSLVGAIAALRDSAAAPATVAGTAARALVIFSKGVDGTSRTPQDVADEAIASNVPVYPVALSVASAMYGAGQPGGAFYPYNETFESLGDLTGGRQFEAADSISADKVRDILQVVKTHALARLRSTYTIGFMPSPSGSPREHKLEVRLAAKSSGKLMGGKRSATY